MKIQQATIYGFGKWIDYSIDFSKSSLSCIFGNNESGKSTIHMFVLFMLFGLPPKERTFYQPKTSGKMGGRLTVYDPELGKYTIERIDGVRNGAAICYLSDGREFDEKWLKNQLNGMTNTVYQSIYSFSALDLKDFKSMKNEDLGEVLLGVSLTGFNNLYTVERRLDNQMDELFKPNGKIPMINQQLTKLDELSAKLIEYKSNETTYRNKKAQIEILLNEVELLQTRFKKEQKLLLSLERQQQAMPIINEYQYNNTQLDEFPEEIAFPVNGLKRFEILKEKLLPLKSELSILKNNQKENQTKHQELQVKILEETVYDNVEEIIKDKNLYERNAEELLRQQDEIDQTTLEINTQLSELNIGLTMNDLESITLPFHIEKMWNELKNRSGKLDLERLQIKEEQRGLKEQRIFILNDLHETEGNLLVESQIDELEKKVNTHKKNVYLENLQAESNDKQTKWAKVKKQKEKNSRSILIGSLILSLLMGIAAIYLTTPFLFNVLAILFVAGFGQWFWNKRTIRETEVLLSLNNEVQTSSVDVTGEERKEAEKLLTMQKRTEENVSLINEQLKSTDIQLAKSLEKEKTFKEQKDQLNQELLVQYEKYPFLRQIEIVYWSEFFHAMKHLIKINEHKNNLEHVYEQIQVFKGLYEAQVKELSKRLQLDSLSNSIEHQLKLIESLLEGDRHNKILLKEHEQAMRVNDEQQRNLNEQMLTYEHEIDELFAIAFVETEDDFYKQANMLEEKHSIDTNIKRIKIQLIAIFSSSSWKEFVINKPDASSLEIGCREIKDSMKDIEVNIDVKRQQLAELNAEVAQMESSESHSETLHRYTMEQEQLRELAHKWSVLKAAKGMLGEAKRTYNDTYLSKVIEQTSIYFKKITSNAYRTIYIPTSDQMFQVEARDGIKYNVNELSQGTIDQLYISLRLSIGKVLSNTNCLPFIIDDAFVHFDAIRTKRIIEILNDIAKDQQILLFTCKLEIVQSLEEDQVIELRNPQEVIT